MSDKKAGKPCKPPVPARPKNLVVLNSKHLPKPPDKFLCENVASKIKDLNLTEQDKENERKKKIKNAGQRFENSDSEEDTYGYLEPVSLSSTNSSGSVGNISVQSQHKKTYEESSKFGDILRKVITRNGSGSSGVFKAVEIDSSRILWDLDYILWQYQVVRIKSGNCFPAIGSETIF